VTNSAEQAADEAARIKVLQRLDGIRRMEELTGARAIVWNGNHRHNDLHLSFDAYEDLLEMLAVAVYLAAKKEGGWTDEEIANAKGAVRHIAGR